MEQHEFRASLNRIRISPFKVRLVADMVRGMNCDAAVSNLQFAKQRGAHYIGKLLKSVMANVTNYNDEHNQEHDLENMYISELRIDEGPMFKRWRAASMGRAVPIRRRTSHISIIIKERASKKAVSEVEE